MQRSTEFIIHGICGAVLAGLIAVSILWWLDSSAWLIAAIASASGFFFAGFYGEDAVEWLKDIWWWS